MGKKSSWVGKKQYGAYKSEARFSKNKKAKLERHLKKYPDDAQAQAALKKVPEYSRKKPVSRVRTSSLAMYLMRQDALFVRAWREHLYNKKRYEEGMRIETLTEFYNRKYAEYAEKQMAKSAKKREKREKRAS